MITIPIHTLSLSIGLILGFVLGGFLFAIISVGEQWSKGWSDGYDAHLKYMKEVLGEEGYFKATSHLLDLNKTKEGEIYHE